MASGKQALLVWCQRQTEGYRDVNVVNFSQSWADGLAFCAIIHRHRPDLIDFNRLQKENREANLTLAFETAARLGITPLLDVEDMFIAPGPEPLSVVTYLSSPTSAAPSSQVAKPTARLSTEKEVKQTERREEMRRQMQKHAENLEKARKNLMTKMEEKEKQKETGNENTNEPIVVHKDQTGPVTSPQKQPKALPKLPPSQHPPPHPSRPQLSQSQPTQPPRPQLKSSYPQQTQQQQPPPQPQRPQLKSSYPLTQQHQQQPPLQPPRPHVQQQPPLQPPRVHVADQSGKAAYCPCGERFNENSKFCTFCGVQRSATTNEPETAEPTSPRRKGTALPVLHPRPHTQQQAHPLSIHFEEFPVSPQSNKQRSSTTASAAGPPIPSRPQNYVRSSTVSTPTTTTTTTTSFSPTQQVDQDPDKRYTVLFDKPPAKKMEGYLYKKGDLGVVKLWKKRWFVLRKQRLFYYLDRPGGPLPTTTTTTTTPPKEEGIMNEVKTRGRALTDSLISITKAASAGVGYPMDGNEAEKDVALGFISLLDVDSVEDLSGPDFMFCLCTTERVWMLHAESEEEKQFWVNGLKEEIGYLKRMAPEYIDKPVFRGSDIKMRDIMKKQGSLLKQGLLGWSERWFVLKDGILFHSKTRTSGQPEKVPLYHSQLKEYPEKENAFQITYSKKHTIVIQAHTQMEKDEWCSAILKQTIVIEEAISNINM